MLTETAHRSCNHDATQGHHQGQEELPKVAETTQAQAFFPEILSSQLPILGISSVGLDHFRGHFDVNIHQMLVFVLFQ